MFTPQRPAYGVASWVLGRTSEVDKLLSFNSEKKRPLVIMGYAEENNVVFLKTPVGLFMIHLESFQFKKLLRTKIYPYYYPIESVCIAETDIRGGRDGTDLLHNT